MIGKITRFTEKISSRSSLLLGLYRQYYRGIVEAEVSLAKIGQTDRILCIGGGAIPSTALAIQARTNAKISVIDMDQDAVKRAQSLIFRIGLKDKILVDVANGGLVDVANYDVIHVALQVTPKALVLDNILSNARAGTRIIVRRPKKLLARFYSQLPGDFTAGYQVEKRQAQIRGLTTMDQAMVLVKN